MRGPAGRTQEGRVGTAGPSGPLPTRQGQHSRCSLQLPQQVGDPSAGGGGHGCFASPCGLARGDRQCQHRSLLPPTLLGPAPKRQISVAQVCCPISQNLM